MTLIVTAAITCAFALTYALLLAMLGTRSRDLVVALTGRPRQSATVVAVSRRFSLA
jgi:sulfur carrier protein ThiS